MRPLFGMNVLLGLMAAALWGGGDFFGSVAVKRAGGGVRSALTTVVIGHSISLPLLCLLATFAGEPFPTHRGVVWALVGGAVSGVSLVAFYMALASGHMGSAAAVSGLLCAAVPAVFSGLVEGAPGVTKLLGFLVAAGAIWMIAGSSKPNETASRRALVLSVAGGIGFGIYFVALRQAGSAGILWPTAAARIGSDGVCAAILLLLLLRGGSALPAAGRARTLLWVIGGCLLDTGGNLSFLASARLGRLDVAAVLAAIYPAGTILLAAAILREKTTARQRWGMALALPAVVLITL